MHFELDDEQEQLRASLVRLLQERAPFAQRKRLVDSERGWDPSLWPALAALGVTALVLPEADEGFGQRPVALLPTLQALGASLAVQPFLATAVLAATALVRAGSAAQRKHLLPGIADGSWIVAFAHDEAGARHEPLWVETRARSVEGRWLLDGGKRNVLFGADAGAILVSARDALGAIRLFLVDPAQPGVKCDAARLIDDTPAADLTLSAAHAEPLPGDGQVALQAACDAGTAATCAEALGVAERAYALTVEYVQARQQFGRAIGSNQAVRHRIAEMRVALEMLRSAAMAGLLALDIEDEDERTRELARARMLVARHGLFIAQQAIQLHGGIGMTIEYDVGHCMRRMTVLDMLFGDGASHAARLGAMLARGIVASDDERVAPAP